MHMVYFLCLLVLLVYQFNSDYKRKKADIQLFFKKFHQFAKRKNISSLRIFSGAHLLTIRQKAGFGLCCTSNKNGQFFLPFTGKLSNHV